MESNAEENTKLNDCFYEKKDWRACKDEVGLLPIRRTGVVSWTMLSCWRSNRKILTR